ncbi:MAG TPA: hypothetical protein VIL24_05370 [Clostridia bacterium]
MKKKILIFLLCLVFAFSGLTGCKIFVLDEDKDYAESVAVIESRSLPIKIKQEDGSYKDGTFTSERKTITKLQLYSIYLQYGPTYQNQYRLSVKGAYDKLLEHLIERELMIIKAEKLLASNEIRFKQSELNKVWKDVYDAIDDEIYEYEADIAKEYGEEIYERDEGVDVQPEWPEFKYPYEPDQDDEDYPIENNIIMDEEVWRPEGSRGPIFDYAIIEHGTEEAKERYFMTDEYRKAALKTEALRRFLQNIKDKLNTYALSSADLAKFNEDLKEIEKYNDSKPYEYAKLYAKLQDFWFIKYLYYNDYYNALLLDKLQEYAEGNITVGEEEINSYYNKKWAEQKASFDADVNNYISALKENNQVILYHPNKDVKFFYVKHILIPFSDQQKAKLESYKNRGYTEQMIKDYRNRLANEITSYMHINGNNYGDRMTIAEIENIIKNRLTSTPQADKNAARKTFEELIYLFNTDPGMFDNKFGYGMQYTYPETGTSGYMPEFEEAAFKLYEKREIGAVEKAITDYGVHYIMLYSIVKPGTKELGEWINDFGLGAYSIQYEEALRRELLESKKADAYARYQNKTLKQLKREWEPYVSTYPKRYNRLIKLAKG